MMFVEDVQTAPEPSSSPDLVPAEPAGPENQNSSDTRRTSDRNQRADGGSARIGPVQIFQHLLWFTKNAEGFWFIVFFQNKSVN